MNDWFEIFRAGTWVDSQGRERKFSEEDLDRIVSQYNPETSEAPLVVGHPRSNHPAYGWVKALKRVGDRLLALPHQVMEEFANLVRQGRFKKRSISITPDLRLVHVGFLGAVPPAVQGLKDVEFTAASEVYEYEERRMPLVGRLFRRLREFMIEKFGMEAADAVMSNWEVEELERTQEEEQISPAYETNQETDDMDQEKIQALEARLIELQNQAAEKEALLDRYKAEAAVAAGQQRRSQFAAFCEPLVAAGRLTPAQQAIAIGLMESLHELTEIEFSSEVGKKTPLAAFQELLSALPVQVPAGELATGPGEAPLVGDPANYSGAVDEERLALHQQAAALARKENITYREAVRRVLDNVPA